MFIWRARFKWNVDREIRKIIFWMFNNNVMTQSHKRQHRLWSKQNCLFLFSVRKQMNFESEWERERSCWMRHETAGYRAQRTNQPTLSTTTMLTERDISMTSWRLHDTKLKMTKHFSIDSKSSTPNVSTHKHTQIARAAANAFMEVHTKWHSANTLHNRRGRLGSERASEWLRPFAMRIAYAVHGFVVVDTQTTYDRVNNNNIRHSDFSSNHFAHSTNVR